MDIEGIIVDYVLVFAVLGLIIYTSMKVMGMI